jgi:catalase
LAVDQSGNFPEWELQVQLFDQEFADSFDFDVLDPTKLIPEEILPPQPVGRLVLDRMPDNFFAETEQVAFMTQNVPPGIDFSNDPLLQGRIGGISETVVVEIIDFDQDRGSTKTITNLAFVGLKEEPPTFPHPPKAS